MGLYILMTLFGLLIVAIGVLGILGSRLPETHVAIASIELAAPPQKVWDRINDMESFPSWVPEMTKMERLPDENGKQVWRQTSGRNVFTTVNEVWNPPKRVLRTIKDEKGPFSGSWDHVIEDLDNGRSKLSITETGKIPSAIPRAILHYCFGETYYLQKFLDAVKARIG